MAIKITPDPETLGELSAKVNDILSYGDTEIRELIPELIREFHNQLMSDPKTLVAMKSRPRYSPPDNTVGYQPSPPDILNPMGKRFTHRPETLKKNQKGNKLSVLPQKTNPQEPFESLSFPEKRFMDTLPELISFVDRDLKYKFNNASYEKWFGLKTESLYDTKIHEMLGSHFKKLKPFFEQALDGEIVEVSSPIYFKGTQGRMVQSSYFPYYGENNTVTGFFAVVQGLMNHSDSEKTKIQLLKPPFKKP